jgi:hypothetical protein
MRTRRMAALLAAGGLAAGLGADLTGIAHASGPTRPGQAWNEIFLPFDSGPGSPALCMAAARLSNDNHAPLVALPCDGFQDGGQLLELG